MMLLIGDDEEEYDFLTNDLEYLLSIGELLRSYFVSRSSRVLVKRLFFLNLMGDGHLDRRSHPILCQAWLNRRAYISRTEVHGKEGQGPIESGKALYHPPNLYADTSFSEKAPCDPKTPKPQMPTHPQG